jgi:hypothetical protein
VAARAGAVWVDSGLVRTAAPSTVAARCTVTSPRVGACSLRAAPTWVVALRGVTASAASTASGHAQKTSKNMDAFLKML